VWQLRSTLGGCAFLRQGRRSGQWCLYGTGTQASALPVDFDTSSARTGTSSGHIKVISDTIVGYLRQVIKPDAYSGKRIRFTAYIRTVGISGSGFRGAALWMRVDGDRGTLAFDNMAERVISRSADWTKCEIVLDIPQKSIGITFGLLLGTPGDAWVDDATIEVVGKDVRVTKASLVSIPKSPPAVLAQLRKGYLDAAPEPANLGFEDRR
jgi:hypothetical protein